MNIIIQTYSKHIVFRPDTSRKRDEDDLYIPDYIRELEYSPIAYIRMDRPGKCIASRFASRYYSTAGYGLLLYPSNLIDNDLESYASSICLDRLSCLSLQLSPIEMLDKGICLSRSGQLLFECSSVERSTIDAAIELASSRCFLRTGDMVAIELAERKPLCSREESLIQIRACQKDEAKSSLGQLAFDIIF